ncbi:hypothetical protein [Mycolicibacterium litorale]|uniref:Uncharacterized protein n=1 Tax=Mycolicibacterium litorale TaxID=758802 RepID=A0AAD1MWE8_9MYCO|nr:hypothetical protein [Mycolicibacterium litorale]MCV7417508.1 hypothetical protein [Mycolicibacterium litorale]TDX99975.1 hypothetical protein BCL50_5429 [Mycolicibacterium litorale]BBY18733.1 hypothetical protein MLIT_43250 [Mycolicibacterium litorale]
MRIVCRSVTATVLTAVSLGAAIPAAAQPAPPPTPTITQVPERPQADGFTPFVDNPAIVDPRPQSIESWGRLPDDRALVVRFTSGTPECFGVHAEVQETADIVAVKVRHGTLPEAVNRACIAIGVFASLPVGLQAPLGNRAVVSIT